MTRNSPLWLQMCLGLCSQLIAQNAYAQANPAAPGAAGAPPPAAGAPAAAPSGLEPPKLLAESPARYPEEAKAQRLEATVLLQLAIDATGQVTDAQVLEPAGHGFDEAAREAALHLRFDPAKRNGTPIPAKIRFPYPFKLAPEPPPAPITGSISGEVKRAGAPVPQAHLVLRPLQPPAATLSPPPEQPSASPTTPLPPSAALSAPAPNTQPTAAAPAQPTAAPLETQTDATGAFRFDELPPGSYELRAADSDQTHIIAITAGNVTKLALDLPAPPPIAAAPSDSKVTEVTVTGRLSEVQRLQQSAEAVNVIDTRKAKEQTADMGEVLARTQGVAVRRDGGLGSYSRFSLNGLYDEQVRFFLDGVPLEIAGFPTGVANVPVNLIERVEVYRGVVPIRFGADALGGAVNLVTDTSYQNRLATSYQVGSFGTHRITLDGRYRHDPTGFIFGASGYVDIAKNNYKVDVEIPDERGRPSPATVSRFHDAYRAYGATLEAGIVHKPWAKRLLLRGIVSTYDKELQNNIVMSVPYGEVTYGESVIGSTLRYEVEPRDDINVEVVGSYSLRTIDYMDTSKWVYNWRGERVRERPVAGEIDSRPHDQSIWQHTTFGRAIATWKIAPEHQVRASFTPQFATRQGDERIQANPNGRDPLTALRDLFTFVSGVEYELDLFGDRLSNIVFVKDYYYSAQSEERLPGDVYKKRDSKKHTQGVGDSLRLRITPWLYAKASYEYATRLPTSDEVFGNGVLIAANLDLEPEVSHNGNLGPRFELQRTPLGDFTLDINGFIRSSERLIVLLGSDRQFTYQNVYSALGMGLENALAWSSPGRWVGLDGMLTWQDQRNKSTQGTFADFDGDRIPNRPYLFGSWGARVRIPNLPGPADTLEPFYSGRYVHSFYRGWESQGLKQFKQTVDAQISHNVGVSYIWSPDIGRITTTLEIDNLTNAKLFDNFGVQRPGRAFYVKITGELK